MKTRINKIIDWFENRFNFIIDFVALLGATFCIVLSIVVFFTLLFNNESVLDSMTYIVVPGLLGFFGILMLFALRITRHITKKD